MDSTDLIRMIKRAAVEAVNASKPANIVFGKVVSADPLRIQIDQKLILSKNQLVVCEHLTDHECDLTIGETTQTYTIHNALASDDKVILMQIAGGQKYVVIDRTGGD